MNVKTSPNQTEGSHQSRNCSSNKLRFECKKCHHTLLHVHLTNPAARPSPNNQTASTSQAIINDFHLKGHYSTHQILLDAAIAFVYGQWPWSRCMCTFGSGFTGGINQGNEHQYTCKSRFLCLRKTKSGHSLNDCLHVGMRLQNELYMIALAKEDTEFHRIVWRSTSDHEIRDYRLPIVTFCTSCALYLAIKTLRQLAECEERNCCRSIAQWLLIREWFTVWLGFYT